MEIPLDSGRECVERDRFGAPDVVVVNRAFGRRFYPGENPIGKRIYLCWDRPNFVAEIVGVVEDARQRDLRKPAQPTIFVANLQEPAYSATFVIRSREEPERISRAVVSAIHRVNPDQAVSDIRTMEEVRNAAVSGPRLQSVVLTFFGGMALLLAAVGVYGVVSYSIEQRTQEIGVRMAVGASGANIADLVLREGMLLCGIGVTAGLAAAYAVTRYLASLLFEITPTDPVTLLSVCAVLVLVTAAAMAVPLRRALRVEPSVALRYE